MGHHAGINSDSSGQILVTGMSVDMFPSLFHVQTHKCSKFVPCVSHSTWGPKRRFGSHILRGYVFI